MDCGKETWQRLTCISFLEDASFGHSMSYRDFPARMQGYFSTFLNLLIHFYREVVSFLTEAISGTIATIATYPFDLLRTRFAVQGTNKVYSGILDSISQIKQKEGISGFYRGLTPSVLSIIPQMGMVFEVHRFLRGHYHKIEIQDSILTPFISGSKEIVSGGIYCFKCRFSGNVDEDSIHAPRRHPEKTASSRTNKD